MKVIILAGGFGTRLSEYTNLIPKPMVPVGGLPIIWHIMARYAHFDHKDFYLALGYKADVIKDYFSNYYTLNSNFSVNLGTGAVSGIKRSPVDWKVTMIDTGDSSMTGGRVKRMKSFIGNEPFMLTYGDGLADIDLDALLKFHKSHGKMVTISAVRPPARFGELDIKNGAVVSFKEKPQLQDGWINGGYFVCQPEFFEFIDGDSTMLEREPLEMVARNGELMAYEHKGFWQCMDTKRDQELLESIWIDNPPWLVSM
jgi:glucose-1-phosphate cytidylyltransferase